jgi:hypothetical protein
MSMELIQARLILVNFTFERKNEDKHRETIDHIVNSIKL